MISYHSILHETLAEILPDARGYIPDLNYYCSVPRGYGYIEWRDALAPYICLNVNRFAPNERFGIISIEPIAGMASGVPCTMILFPKEEYQRLMLEGFRLSNEYCIAKHLHILPGEWARTLVALRWYDAIYGYVNGYRLADWGRFADFGLVKVSPFTAARLQCDLLYSTYELCVPCVYWGRGAVGGDTFRNVEDLVESIIGVCMGLERVV